MTSLTRIIRLVQSRGYIASKFLSTNCRNDLGPNSYSNKISLASLTFLNDKIVPEHKKVQAPLNNVLTAFVVVENHWIYQQNDKIKSPTINKVHIELPNGLKWVPPLIEPDSDSDKVIEAPATENSNITKEAITMLVVRRKKMKKHKLKKLRKKMKFEWAKQRQRRELRKEKLFQAELIQKCKEGEAFSAEKYVEERIGKLNEIIIPRFWKGKRLPEFLIREKMGLPPKS